MLIFSCPFGANYTATWTDRLITPNCAIAEDRYFDFVNVVGWNPLCDPNAV